MFIVGCSIRKIVKEPKKKSYKKEFTSILEEASKIGINKIYYIPLSGIYEGNRDVINFINEMVDNYHYDYNQLVTLFNNAKLELISLKLVAPKVYYKKYKYLEAPLKKSKSKKRRYSRYGSWDRYKKYFLTKRHIRKGVEFWKKYRDDLERAYQIYGVPPEYILGIMGVETIYGVNTGRHLVFDTLATLAFEKHRRANYFKRELRKFLLMSKREGLNVAKLKGSYAGAIGLGQFMPSNFEHFAVDFNNDGVADLWNPIDAIGSIANYLKINGWRRDEPVAVRAKYRGMRFRKLRTGYKTKYSRKRLRKKYKITPRKAFKYKRYVSLIKLNRYKYDELWITTKNFYVITRYNHSAYYAMAVHKLAQIVKNRYLATQTLASK